LNIKIWLKATTDDWAKHALNFPHQWGLYKKGPPEEMVFPQAALAEKIALCDQG
jgi:hypothetical protein